MTDTVGKPKGKSEAVVLKQYFGFLPNQDLKSFAAELRELDPADKTELAQLAAKELGTTLK